MADNMIVSEKELNYIETLYLYANLEDFVTTEFSHNDHWIGEPTPDGKVITREEVDESYGVDKYNFMLGYVEDSILINSKELGESKGRRWYQLPNYRLGIMDYDKSKIANQPNVIIQYEQHYMFGLDRFLLDLELPFGGVCSDYMIKRIDITKIFKSKVDYTLNHNYISPYRNIGGYNRHDNTVYLGSRKNGNVFRMYPKTKELNDTENYKKIDLLSKYFGDIEDLYTFELELHRSYLKGTLGIETLYDLDKVYQAYSNIVGKIRIYEDTDHNKSLISRNKRERIKAFLITEFKEYERVSKKKYKPSVDYMVDRTIKTFNKYEKSLEEPLTFANKLSIADRILSGLFGDKDIILEIEESDYILENNILKDKIKLLRDNQDDELFKESNQAFAPIMLQKSEDVF